MKLSLKVALVTGALALGVSPALADTTPTYTTPSYQYAPAPPPQAKAYGYYCRGESKRHVKGQKGTPFSLCVRAMARATHNSHMPPGRACKGELKKHVKGQKGTPFSRCVVGVAQLRKDLQQHS